MKSQIQPITFWQEVATQLEIELVQIKSFGENGSAIICWNLKNNSGSILKNGTIVIDGSDYSLWSSDDNYILNYTAEKLNLIIIEATGI